MSTKPKIVCLCGSSKFPEAHMRVMMAETLAGNIVIPMGLYGHADFPAGARAATNDGDESTEVKQRLDKLHFAKIDCANEIIVVSVGGYIGSSTQREINYAKASGKDVRYYDESAPQPPAPATETPSLTPETDMKAHDQFMKCGTHAYVRTGFAEKLELARNAALSDLATARTDAMKLEAKRDEACKERDTSNGLIDEAIDARMRFAELLGTRECFAYVIEDSIRDLRQRLERAERERDEALSKNNKIAASFGLVWERLKSWVEFGECYCDGVLMATRGRCDFCQTKEVLSIVDLSPGTISPYLSELGKRTQEREQLRADLATMTADRDALRSQATFDALWLTRLREALESLQSIIQSNGKYLPPASPL